MPDEDAQAAAGPIEGVLLHTAAPPDPHHVDPGLLGHAEQGIEPPGCDAAWELIGRHPIGAADGEWSLMDDHGVGQGIVRGTGVWLERGVVKAEFSLEMPRRPRSCKRVSLFRRTTEFKPVEGAGADGMGEPEFRPGEGVFECESPRTEGVLFLFRPLLLIGGFDREGGLDWRRGGIRLGV